MKINVTIETEYKKLVYPIWLRAVALLALTAEKAGPKIEMDILITGDEKVHRLNREYLQEDHPTDVLSFPMREAGEEKNNFINPPDGSLQLGEVIISYPQAAKQAREHYHSPEKEISMLLVHGILHLLGYDHDIPEREHSMRQREQAINLVIEARAL
jgi:probable rRNA maturation factor